MSGGRNRTRVLFLCSVGFVGGAERSLLDIVDTIDRDEFHLEAALLGDGPLAAELESRRVQVHRIPLGKAAGASRSAPLVSLAVAGAVPDAAGAALRLTSLVRRRGFHIVHSNSHKTHYLSIPVPFICRSLLLWHLRDLVKPGIEGRLFRSVASVVPHGLLGNSRATLSSLGNGRARDRCRLLVNAVDTSAYRGGNRSKMRAHWGVGESDFVILHVGAFCPLKGQHRALDVLAGVVRARSSGTGAPAIRLVLVGEELYGTKDDGLDGYRGKVENRLRSLGLEDKVVFAGAVEDMASCYAAGDVLIVTSLPAESFGRMVVEAMAASLPVVAYEAGGPAEIVEHGRSGFLVPAGDDQAMAAAVATIADDPGLRIRMGAAGRERALSRYDRSRLGEELASLYSELLNGRGFGPPGV